MNPESHAAGTAVPPLIEVEGLTKHFPVRGGVLRRKVGVVHAVDDISLAVHEGETLGLVGESGCGKSTTARLVLRLLPASSGSIRYRGRDLIQVSHGELNALRKEMQIIFQDPYASLNPRMTVGNIIREALIIHRIGTREEQDERVKELLRTVGLNPEHVDRYPHEFSGGQRQRIGIARALASRPKFVVCDEPISALDVSIQAQVVNLLRELQREFNLTYLFIAHDLAVVRHISDRVAVMYLGTIVEEADVDRIYDAPFHPYTQSLLSAVPIPDPKKQRARQRIVLQGDVPSPIDPPSGCRFHTRCPIAQFPLCASERPLLREVEPGHRAACHFARAYPVTDDRAPGADSVGA